MKAFLLVTAVVISAATARAQTDENGYEISFHCWCADLDWSFGGFGANYGSVTIDQAQVQHQLICDGVKSSLKLFARCEPGSME